MSVFARGNCWRSVRVGTRDMTEDDLIAVARAACQTAAGVRVATRDGGAIVEIATQAARCTIALQGAQVLSWQPAGIDADVLWCSPLARLGGGGAIRGGIPICWPWFGPHPDGGGRPQHGYARTALWHLEAVDVDAAGAVGLRFSLPTAAQGARGSGAGVAVAYSVHVGAALSVALDTRNGTGRDLPLTQALHTYFAVGDAAAVVIEGLDGARFRDNTDGGRDTRQHGALRPGAETIALFDEAPATATLVDPVLRRRTMVRRTAGRSTIVWQPGLSVAKLADVPADQAHRFVCIESGDIGAAAQPVAPAGAARIAATYEVDPL